MQSHYRLSFGIVFSLLAAAQVSLAVEATALIGTDTVKKVSTPDGVEFAILGSKPRAPAPTLFIFAVEADNTLAIPKFLRCGNHLAKEGYLCVSIDLPCHGSARRSNEPEGLAGWRHRVNAGEDFVVELNERLRKVLDHLVDEGFTDASRVAACGSSRGGFAALHFAAADPRVKCVAVYSPVTDLKGLNEFRGAEEVPLTRKLSVSNLADRLAGRPVWIVIGDRDERVGTDLAIEFARKLSASSAAKDKSVPSQVELHVCPSLGHPVPAGAEEQSAAWIIQQMSGETP